MKRVIVHIDRLVLKDLRHEDRHAVASGLERELMRLLAASDSARHLARLGVLHRLRAGSIRVPRDVRPHQIGIATAQAIDRGAKP
jgi:hypothetical protein